MILKRCKKGHCYDGDKYQSCPHCQEEGQDTRARHILRKKTPKDHTVPMYTQQEEQVTMLQQSAQDVQSKGSALKFSLEQDDPVTVSLVSGQSRHASNLVTVQDEPMTMPLSSVQEQPVTNPMPYQSNKYTGQDVAVREKYLTVGWFVCIQGNNLGESLTIRSGRNFIGCNADMNPVLWNNKDAKEGYAVVYFTPKYKKYIVEPAETRGLCFLNGEIVLNPVGLKKYDILSFEDIRLMFVPLCGEGFSWSKM